MALLDALLLDPYRMDVWISATRTDGAAGSGTQSDPYDGSTQAKFDALMSDTSKIPASPPVRVHLGPGIFQTAGYGETAPGGWQTKPGMKIVGSGIDVTTLRLADGLSGYSYYAIGHPLSISGQANLMDFFEVSDLTIDCNLAGTGVQTSAAAVRVMGNHAKIRRIKVINWGTKTSSKPCFVISAITADQRVTTAVEDCGIEECIVLSPGSGNTGPATLFHAGGYEQAAAVSQPALGLAPYIRNCFGDSGQQSPFGTEISGISMAWCKAGTIEGNQIHNVMYGAGSDQPAGAQDLVVRNNWFKNVRKGLFPGRTADPAGGSGTVSKPGSDPQRKVSLSSAHTLGPGDLALLTTSGAYNGTIVAVLSNPAPTSTEFWFNTSNSASSDSVSSVQRVLGVTNLIVDGNVVELAPETDSRIPRFITGASA